MIRTQLFNSNSDLGSFLTCADEFIKENKGNDFYDEDWLTRECFYEVAAGRTSIQTYVALEENNKTIGFIMGSKRMIGIYEIRNHYILPGYRRKGIAKQLKLTLTDYAKEEGYKLILSDVAKDNKASVRLNETLGWEKKELDEWTWRYMKQL